MNNVYENQAEICLNSKMLVVWVEGDIFNVLFLLYLLDFFAYNLWRTFGEQALEMFT